MSFEIRIKSPEDLPGVAKLVLHRFPGKKIFAFSGELGAGKTTIIKALCRELGVRDKAVSPTFGIVNEYSGAFPVYHIDLYRLNNVNEVLDIGIEEYLSSGNYCFIEWPELIESLLPGDSLILKIATGEKDERIMTVEMKSQIHS